MASLVDPKNIQGDIISGLPKKAEAFFFFDIVQVQQFRARLLKLIPHISSVQQVVDKRKEIEQHKKAQSGLLPTGFVNIAFSSKGLKKLGLTDDIQDRGFSEGMLVGAGDLGDEGTKPTSGPLDPDWIPEFKKEIDGVILVAAHSQFAVKEHLTEVLAILHQSVKEVFNIIGHVRPGKEDGHEHFGFQDGISNPAVQGFDTELPGEGLVDQGVILLGRQGDNLPRPAWALDGSFLAFRLLNQLVPEFNKFLIENGPKLNDPTASGPELLGARFVGRWKSGAPIDVTPLRDDPVLAADSQRNNNFQYDPASQERCPFAAHTRKMNPRSDLGEQTVNPHRIIRRGIQFGPEVTHAEASSNKTEKDRGLLFVSYQANLGQGFQFLQEAWANPTNFPPGKPQLPGNDLIIGQNVSPTEPNNDGTRTITGFNPGDLTSSLKNIQRWVVAKGGEYFFTPSISALKNTFAQEAKTEL